MKFKCFEASILCKLGSENFIQALKSKTTKVTFVYDQTYRVMIKDNMEHGYIYIF